ncbi:TetR/AcrR family transcriptional regulator [Amycolatopsis sp. NPDC021455]|uniref:TetR/AcrR family transcriptional regulator n=1 Tax=Amycolatopsis sp. NPDC021455 TaxID=3154901 RepID=UPI00340F62BB
MAHVPAVVRRTQIIEAAAAVIARDGVAGATTRRIAAEAGLSLATLHYVFQTKDDILAAVLESLIDRAREDNAKIAARLAAPADGSPALREVIHELVRTAWGLLDGDLVTQRLQFELILYALRTPEATHLGRTLRDYHLTATEEIIRRTLDHTGHTVHHSPRDLAQLISASVDGLLLDHLVNPDPDQAERSLANLTDAVFALVTATPAATG